MKSKLDTLNKLKTIKFDTQIKGDSPIIWLTRGYILALTILACLTGLSHMITSRMINHEITGAEISYTISQEINLIGQVERYTSTFYDSQEDYDRTFLTQRLDELKGIHTKLQTYLISSESEGATKDGLRKVMLQEPFNLEARIKSFIENTDYFLTYDKKSKSPDRQAAYKKVTENTQKTLIKPLQFSLEDYQENQITEAKYLHGLQIYMVLGILIVIMLEALFIFMPLVRRVKKYSDILKRQSMEDTLTGLKNRRALGKDFIVVQKMAARDKKKFVVVSCDVDKFKSINEKYGHDVGDIVLKHFSSILTNALRPNDIVARMGGEKFVIVLNNTDANGAAIVLERIRKKTEETVCRYAGGEKPQKLNYTTSIGYIEGPFPDEAGFDDYFRPADEALYKAKAEGRNKVINASEAS